MVWPELLLFRMAPTPAPRKMDRKARAQEGRATEETDEETLGAAQAPEPSPYLQLRQARPLPGPRPQDSPPAFADTEACGLGSRNHWLPPRVRLGSGPGALPAKPA